MFDKSISDPANITGDVNKGYIATLLSQFRRCLCKKTAEGEVAICYLDNNDSNFFHDGSSTNLHLNGVDVMVNFPEFYYKHEKIDDSKFKYIFSEHNVDGTFKHVSRSLVGAYKASVSSNKLYSVSRATPTTHKSFNDFEYYAESRGRGYQIIDFQQHCVIAFMLYAKYGTRNLQAVLGLGGAVHNPATTTGSSNATGNVDTKNERSKYVCGLGLEGVFGGIYEWVKGVEINNHVWKITDSDGEVRNVNAGDANGFITNVSAENGPFFDMTPTNIGGSDENHYSDYYLQRVGGPFVLARSMGDSSAHGGVAFVSANCNSSSTNSYHGSRLAFRGIIKEIQDPIQFNTLPIVYPNTDADSN